MALPLKYNFRNIIVRKGSTLATAFTIGLTVAVFLMVMALARGIDLTLSSSGEPLNLIVLREGSTAELNSTLTRENFNDVMYLDGVEREGDKPLATAELITLIYKARKGMNQGSNVTVRGVGPNSFKLRSGFETVAGRLFQPGLTEAVVSKRIAERFQGLDIGDKFRIQTTDYTVVGLFDSAGKAFESEIWVDINSLASTTKRDIYSSVLLRAKDQNALAALTKRITDDPKLHFKALAERTFYEDQQGTASGALKGIGDLHLIYHGGWSRLCRYEHDVCCCGSPDKRDRHSTRTRFRPAKYSDRLPSGICSDCAHRCADRNCSRAATQFCFHGHVELGDV